ncbi:hypothetical protein S40285_09480 [Stachybotrys chlorohalonatus IBT 40285]|uniref:DUF6536 domain-containing protein n=1 Tax=Stachybotrys chlorohalonatus (strain IBT 40285) TaxID=1283841 RepID=A0A084QPK5_STAC4|nr:hypothetical protein S40285_09480 [Stachybotrys chlorohalonata IBT 40285]
MAGSSTPRPLRFEALCHAATDLELQTLNESPIEIPHSPHPRSLEISRSLLDDRNADLDTTILNEHWDESEAERGELTGLIPGPKISRYAKVSDLRMFVPELDPNHKRAQTLRVKMARRSTLLKIQAGIAAFIVSINVATIVGLSISYPLESRGIGTIMFGRCSSVETANAIVHVVLNIMSSLLLGAGNYCMQILVAPSRREIDEAHSRGIALDIGIMSFRNLWHIRWTRVVMWLLLGSCATVLHLIWNSAIFMSRPVAAIPRAIVTNDFLTSSDDWETSDPLGKYEWWVASHYDSWETTSATVFQDEIRNKSSIYSLQSAAANMTRIDTDECIQRQIDPFKATSAVIVVARNVSFAHANDSSLLDGWVSGWQAWAASNSWICERHFEETWSCDADFAGTISETWTVQAGPMILSVDHCLIGEEGNNDERCGLHYTAHIMGIVCGLASLEALLVILTWIRHYRDTKHGQESTMVTFGDAVQNFLRSPNNAEDTGAFYASSAKRRGTNFVVLEKDHWQTVPRVSWFKAVSIRTWALSLFLFALGLAIPLYMLIDSALTMREAGVNMSPSGIWSRRISGIAVFSGSGADRSFQHLMEAIFRANWLQVMISFLYLHYNNLLTRQLIADEMLGYMREDGKKPLRVSSPIGMQRSSYFLSLPWKYSGPLMGLMVVFHWLISQSVFLIQTSAVEAGRHGTRIPALDYTAYGYDILSGIWACSLGLAMVIGILLLAGLRRWRDVPQDYQLMGYNSSAIECLCQRPRGDTDAHLFPISLGLVSGERGDAKIVFSTDAGLSQSPPAGLEYWRPVFRAAKEKELSSIM